MTHGARTDSAMPRTRACEGADLDLERDPCCPSGADLPISAPHDRRLPTSPVSTDIEQEQPSVGTLLQVVTDLQASEAAALEDRALADRECRRLRLEAARLRAELQEAREEDPKAKLIREILDYWVKQLHKSGRTKCPANGARWNKVRARLGDGFTPAQLKQAIDGCARFPFVGPRGRQPDGQSGAKRHDDIELICRDETTVERFIGYADQAPAAAVTPEPAPSTPLFPPRREKARTELPIDRVILALHGAGCQVVTHQGQHDQWSAQCPAHEDRDPSLSVHRNPDGQVLINCWAGCQTEDVLRVLQLEWRDLWEDSDRDPNRVNARGERAVPSHLRHAMQQLLARDERQAA